MTLYKLIKKCYQKINCKLLKIKYNFYFFQRYSNSNNVFINLSKSDMKTHFFELNKIVSEQRVSSCGSISR